MNIIYVTIKTLSPVVLTASGSSHIVTSCTDYFSGTILRGVVAGLYIHQHKLGKDAQKDTDFCRFFFDKLRFVQANPVVQDARTIVLPLSVMKAKDKSAKPSILDLLMDKPKAGYKGIKGLALLRQSEIVPVSTRTHMEFHMSRCSVSERLGGRSQDGNVFTYESIDSHQMFRGEIIGERDDLQDFLNAMDCAEGSLSCHIGRSKSTQYGQCEISFSPVTEIPTVTLSEHVFLRLDTPLIPIWDDASRAKNVLQCVARTMNTLTNSQSFFIGNIYSASQNIENFVGIWGMYRPQQQALAAGTVFELCKNSAWTDTDMDVLQQCLYSGMGARTEEGFGQLRIWQHDMLSIAMPNKEVRKKKKNVRICSEGVKKVIYHILEKRLLEQIQNQAFDDVKLMQVRTTDSLTHTFARLESWLGNRIEISGVKQRFQQRFSEDVRSGSPLQQHIKLLRVHGDTLYDIFSLQKEMPYNRAESIESIDKSIPVTLAASVGFIKNEDVIFYEYWRWFFRHARKRAIRLNRERKVDSYAE